MGKSIGDRRRAAGLARREEGAYLLVRDRRATQPDRLDRRRGRLNYPFAVTRLFGVLRVLLAEPFDAASCIYNLLLAGIKRMTLTAHVDTKRASR